MLSRDIVWLSWPYLVEMAGSLVTAVPLTPYNSLSLNSYSSNLVQERKLSFKGGTDDIWRVFCRLADPKQPVSVIRQRYLDKTGPTYPCTIKGTRPPFTRVNFMGDQRRDEQWTRCSVNQCLTFTDNAEHYVAHNQNPATSKVSKKPEVRCMCYENVIHFVRQVCCNSAVRLLSTEEKKQMPTRWMRSSMKHFRENEGLQFPLASVIVRWQQKRYPIHFNHKLLHTIFSKFGTVREIRKLSPNSALIIFEELNAACDAIYSNYIEMSGCKLHCRWWHTCMESKAAIGFEKGVKVQPIPYL